MDESDAIAGCLKKREKKSSFCFCVFNCSRKKILLLVLFEQSICEFTRTILITFPLDLTDLSFV